MAKFAILVFLAVVTLIVAKPVPDYDLGEDIGNFKEWNTFSISD